jgi:hypothetical protein
VPLPDLGVCVILAASHAGADPVAETEEIASRLELLPSPDALRQG